MKLHKGLLFFGASVMFLSACSKEAYSTGDIEAETENVSSEDLMDKVAEQAIGEFTEQAEKDKQALEESEEEAARIAIEEEIQAKEEAEKEKSNIGTRSNPIPFGSPLYLSGTFTDYDADYEEFEAQVEVTVIETTRGADAWEIILNENQFNEPAPEGKEYVINRVQLKLSNATSEDLKSMFRESDFDYISESGASYSSVYAVIPDGLRVELYNNGVGEGNVVGLIDIDDNPLLRFESSFFLEIN